MSQDIADLAEGCTSLEHSGRQRMTQDVGALAWKLDPRPRERIFDDHADRHGAGEALVRSPRPDEQASGRARGPTISQIGDDRFTRVGHQRHQVSSWALAVDDQRAIGPVDVVERQRDHLARS